MGCENIHWLHSCGRTNAEPDMDLGNFPSEFKIAEVVMNNLYDDVQPVDVKKGLIDHRCIYFCNKHQKETVEDIFISMEPPQCPLVGSTVEMASKLVNDKQIIFIEGEPDNDGYVIFDTEFGPPFTVYYDRLTHFCGFMARFEAQIKKQPWCSGVIVTPLAPDCNPFLVEFAGEVKNRKVKLIEVIQNNLLRKDWSRYRTASYVDSDTFNNEGEFFIKVTRPINEEYVPPVGILHAYKRDTGTFVPLDYIARGGFLFELLDPLPFDLVGKYGKEGDPVENVTPGQPDFEGTTPSPVFDDQDPPNEVFPPLPAGWGVIEVPIIDHTALVHICKDTHGSPINCIAAPIEIDTDTPDVDPPFDISPLDIGTLRPQECFFLWLRRTTPPGAAPVLRDNFNLKFKGVLVPWPP